MKCYGLLKHFKTSQVSRGESTETDPKHREVRLEFGVVLGMRFWFFRGLGGLGSDQVNQLFSQRQKGRLSADSVIATFKLMELPYIQL